MGSERGRGKSSKGYWSATRHPWPCFLFLVPLLSAYEGGVLCLGGRHAERLRTGADTWLHWGLEALGLHQAYWGPGLVVGILLVWSWLRREDRPEDLLGICTGMVMESGLFALGLWGISRGLSPLLHELGITLAAAPPADNTLLQVLTFVGAGIYEEVLFRLVLYTGLLGVLQQVEVPPWAAFLLAAAGSALLFSTAHHLGSYGEPFVPYVFLFRTIAGLYFTLLFQFRGFGVAVGAHACYDLLVGLLVG